MDHQQHFALVPSGSQPLSLPPASSDTGKKKIRSELTDLYQSYADLYPNPKLVEEARQRDTLLQAASAAANFSNSQPKAPKRGFFSRLFGGGDENSTAKDENADPNVAKKKGTDSDPLVYTEMANENADESLCGTLQSIDLTSIPAEAYNLARFHLSSTHQRRDHPNAFRWGPHTPESSLVIVGLGAIAEFAPGQPTNVAVTSDQKDLQDYAVHREPFAIHNARAVAVSANCIAISWGFIDGIIMIYRRMQFSDINIGWEAVYSLGPTRPVLENMTGEGGDFFHDDAEHPGSPLLRVSDCLPLRVETGDERQPLVATLAVSRLGGYIELVPLPAPLWDGPTLTPENHRRMKVTKRRRGQHYARQVDSLPQTLALTTVEYHIDILCLEAFRTSVSPDTDWDREAFPNAPPSEFVLAASGMSDKGFEVLTFWSVSTLFSENFDRGGGGIQFQLHASLLEVARSETGAGVSVFATDGIMKRWRTPRHVALRSDGDISSDTTEHGPPAGSARVTTISTTAPIVTMKFCNMDGASGPFLALLDWNGSITLFDCSVMQRIASQSLQPHEYELLHNANNGGDPFPLVSQAVSRTQFHKCLTKRQQAAPVSNVEWLNSAYRAHLDGVLPPLVLLSGDPLKLLLSTFSREAGNSRDAEDPDASIVSHSFPGKGAAIQTLGDDSLSLVLRRSDSKGTVLHSIQMRQLDPVAIVQSLAKESKFEEAIQAAKKLSTYDQEVLAEVVVDCYKRLWESKRDIDCLAETVDVDYIVEQAISVSQSESAATDLSLEKLRLVCSLAIAMGRNYQPTRDKVAELQSFLVKLGSFELLCGYFSTEISLERFHKEFLGLSVVDLCAAFARRGEINALTLVLFRHRQDIHASILEILETIPLSIHPDAYGHLLPLLKDGQLADSFLNMVDEDSTTHWSQFPQYTSETHGVHIVIDQSDEKFVLDCGKGIESGEGTDLRSLTANWFVDRVAKMQHFVGNVETVVRFCELGLKCTDTSTAEDPVLDSPPAIRRLFATWRSSVSLRRMVVDEIVSLDSESEDSRLSSISTKELLSMDSVELVELVLGGEDDVEKLMLRCTNYLRPLARDTALLKGEQNVINNLDGAVASYCTTLASECNNKGRETGAALDFVKAALACCSAVATTSKTSINKEERLIKDKSTLMGMVTAVAADVFTALQNCDIPYCDSQVVNRLLWTMYEAVPAHIPSCVPGADSWLPMMEKIRTLRKDLVCADILSRWPGCAPFEFAMIRQTERKEADRNESEIKNAVISRVCRSFCSEVRIVTATDKSSLLMDLLSDVENLDESYDSEAGDIPALLSLYLVRPMLQMSEFHVVAQYLRSRPTIVDREGVKRVVLDYVDNAVFAEDGDDSTVVAAIHCQDILGPVIPDLQGGFAAVRRYLDAAHFAKTVIYEGSDPAWIRPAELRRSLPLDIIESILEDVPDSAIRDCPQWADRVFARDANKTLRSDLESKNEPSNEEQSPSAVPVLPGGAIFHLATILGLDSETSALVVKCRVIHHAVKNGFQGAAAAICRGLVTSDGPSNWNDNAVVHAKLCAVAAIVCDDSYGDLSTRREMCLTTLSKCNNNLSVYDSSAFNALVQASAVLEHRSSRFSREQQDLPADRHQTLLRRPIARMYRHIQTEYNADVHGLCSDLLGQTARSSVHDTLMNALSRFTIYWCISYSKTLQQSKNPIDKADFQDYLALGCSLILHIPSNETANNCVNELQQIAADQAASVSAEERFNDEDDVVVPEQNWVRQLIGRGYTANAAQRAVIMTNNRGYNEALSWAVAHTMDDDFNAPVMILKIAGRKFIDENLLQALHRCLFASSRYVQNLDDVSVFLKELAHMQTPDALKGDQQITERTYTPETSLKSLPKALAAEPKSKPPPKPLPNVKVSAHAKVLRTESGQVSQPTVSEPSIHPGPTNKSPSSMQPIPPTPPGFQSKRTIIVSSRGLQVPPDVVEGSRNEQEEDQSTLPRGQPLANGKDYGNTARSLSLTPQGSELDRGKTGPALDVKKGTQGKKEDDKTSPPPPPAPPASRPRAPPLPRAGGPASRLARGLNELKLDTSRAMAEAKSPRQISPGGLSPYNAEDREELRKRGKQALTRLRTKGSPAEDRRRLIEEGRQLLRLARASGTPTAPARHTPKARAVPPPPPPKPKAQTTQNHHTPVARAPPPSPPPKPVAKSEEEDSEWDFDSFDDF